MAENSFTAAFQKALDNITTNVSSSSSSIPAVTNLSSPSPTPSAINQQAVAATGTEGAFASNFGLPIGAVPGGSAVDFLGQAGFPSAGLDLIQMLTQGGQLPAPNLGLATDAFGGVPIPSPQSIRNNPDFLASFFESVLGIPFDQIIRAALMPFLGLRQAPTAQAPRGGGTQRRR